MRSEKRKVRSVLFICTGNSCRSVMAEALMRKRLLELGRDAVEIRSAGVAAFGAVPPTAETVEVLKEEGIDVAGFKTKRVTGDMVRAADLILAMEPSHKEEILNLDPGASGKTFLVKEFGNPSKISPEGLSIHDPIGMPVEQYRLTRDELKQEIERIVQQI